MPVPTLISQLSTTASLNSPDGAVDVPSSIDDYQRAHASFIAVLRDQATSIINGDTPVTNATNATNAPLSFRNKIINGDMRIDQRNAGAAVTPTTSTYLVDRFTAVISQASKLTFQQVADAPTGFKFSTKITVASQFAPAAGDFFNYSQRIEGPNIIDLAFGTASAAAITVSFYAKTSVAGTYSASLANKDSDRTYVFSVALTTSWAKYTVTIPGETTGTWATYNAIGLILRFNLGMGTNYQTASPNTWLAGDYLAATGSIQFVNQTAGATLNITGVQLEAGTVATPFENRPIGTELALCQRYYQHAISNMRITAAAVDNYLQSNINFAVTMRAGPTTTNVSAGSSANINTVIVSTAGGIAGARVEATASAAGDAYVLNRIDAFASEL